MLKASKGLKLKFTDLKNYVLQKKNKKKLNVSVKIYSLDSRFECKHTLKFD